jgi:hypothetical protein
MEAQVGERLELVKRILWQEMYWEHFLTELDKPDCAAFKVSVGALLR